MYGVYSLQSGLGVRNIARSASMPLNKLAPLRRQGSGNGATVLLKPTTPRAADPSSVDDSTSTQEESLPTQSDPEKGMLLSPGARIEEHLMRGIGNTGLGCMEVLHRPDASLPVRIQPCITVIKQGI